MLRRGSRSPSAGQRLTLNSPSCPSGWPNVVIEVSSHVPRVESPPEVKPDPFLTEWPASKNAVSVRKQPYCEAAELNMYTRVLMLSGWLIPPSGRSVVASQLGDQHTSSS